jgi:hypothetical protein
MKKTILPLAVLAMLGLIAAAMALDCLRLAADARGRVELADEEMVKHELRLVTLLAGFGQLSPEVQAAIAAYRKAEDAAARHGAYAQLVTSFRQTMSGKVDPTNSLDRKFMDDVVGAINRREIAQKSHDDEDAAYQEYLSGRRGGVARMFSARARLDWKTGD